MSNTELLIADLDRRMLGLRAPTTAQVRAIRRALSRQLRTAEPRLVLELADRLVVRDGPFDRFLAYEILSSHRNTHAQLRAADLRRLGRGIDSWGDVDTFACYVSGPSWREGQIADAEVTRWARSPDRRWCAERFC